VNVNSATADEAGALAGRGPPRRRRSSSTARPTARSSASRTSGEVKGIGDKALERLRPHVTLDGKTTAQPAD
jgi:hypothetical protein